MTSTSISLIQTGLRDLGYEPGPIDGVFGTKTRAATTNWLAADGEAKKATLAVESRSLITQGNKGYPVHEIVVHCSATRPGWMSSQTLADQIKEIRSWHRDLGWSDIGYHWIIGRNGDVMPGRAENVIGAGVQGHNQGVIHICLIGGHGSSSNDQFTDNFTIAQDVSLEQLIQGISMRTQIREISGHNQYAAKACPGFNVPNWLKGA